MNDTQKQMIKEFNTEMIKNFDNKITIAKDMIEVADTPEESKELKDTIIVLKAYKQILEDIDFDKLDTQKKENKKMKNKVLRMKLKDATTEQKLSYINHIVYDSGAPVVTLEIMQEEYKAEKDKDKLLKKWEEEHFIEYPEETYTKYLNTPIL